MEMGRVLGQIRLRRESAAIIRKTIAAQNTLPVKSQTTTASNTAGRKIMNKPIKMIMITPIITKTKAKAKSAPKLPKIDWRKVRIMKILQPQVLLFRQVE